jgi:hypothetical protein
MYYIAPLLFWACAEMTCGFFILGVPCIPCLIKRSGLQDKITSVFGVSLGSSNNRSIAHRERHAQALSDLAVRIPKNEALRHDPYNNYLGTTQDGLPVYTPGRSESQESLRAINIAAFEVRRTTQTIINSDPCPRNHLDELKDRVSPWDASTNCHNGSSQVRNYSVLNTR